MILVVGADEGALPKADVSAGVAVGLERCWDALVATELTRPTERLLVVVAATDAMFVDVEAIDPAEGGRGGRRVVVDVNEVAIDFGRGRVVRGNNGFAVEVVEAEGVGPRGEGREEVVGEGFGMEDIDFGLIILVLVVMVGRAGFEGSAAASVFSVAGLRVFTVLERFKPNIPEFGLLLVAVVPAAGPVVPARGLVVVNGPPGFGSLLGDMFPDCSADTDADIDAGAVAIAVGGPPTFLLLVSRVFAAMRGSVLSPSVPGALPRPAAGCRRERDLLRPVVEDKDDMIVKGCR